MKENYGNKIHGYVIMPNHIHLLIFITDRSPELKALIFNGKRFLGIGLKKILLEDRKNHLLNFFAERKTKSASHFAFFEPRYDSLQITTQKFYLEKLNYIHNNPCSKNWNLADQPEEYSYSSASNYILGKGIYEVDITGFN